MQRIGFLLAMTLVLGTPCLHAADVTGQWVAQVPGRDGNRIETTFVLRAEGEKLAGSMENQYGQRDQVQA
jgi:hypothetical protein